MFMNEMSLKVLSPLKLFNIFMPSLDSILICLEMFGVQSIFVKIRGNYLKKQMIYDVGIFLGIWIVPQYIEENTKVCLAIGRCE